MDRIDCKRGARRAKRTRGLREQIEAMGGFVAAVADGQDTNSFLDAALQIRR